MFYLFFFLSPYFILVFKSALDTVEKRIYYYATMLCDEVFAQNL